MSSACKSIAHFCSYHDELAFPLIYVFKLIVLLKKKKSRHYVHHTRGR